MRSILSPPTYKFQSVEVIEAESDGAKNWWVRIGVWDNESSANTIKRVFDECCMSSKGFVVVER